MVTHFIQLQNLLSLIDSSRSVFLNRGSTEPLVFDGAVSGVWWKSFNTLTLSRAYPGGRWPLDFERNIGRRKT